MIPIIMILAVIAMLIIRVLAGYVVYIFYIIAFAAFVGFGVYLLIPTTVTSKTFILKQNRVVSIIVAVLSFLFSVLIIAVFYSFK